LERPTFVTWLEVVTHVIHVKASSGLQFVIFENVSGNLKAINLYSVYPKLKSMVLINATGVFHDLISIIIWDET
jgi:hypothetical protein